MNDFDALREQELLSQRVAELQRINKEKAGTIAEITARNDNQTRTIQGLRDEVQTLSSRVTEITNLCNDETGRADNADKLVRDEIRAGILQFAEEHDLDREWVNGLLKDYLDMEPAPEWVEAVVTVSATVRFKAGSSRLPSNLDECFIEQCVDFDLDVRPHYASGLEFEEAVDIFVETKDVTVN